MDVVAPIWAVTPGNILGWIVFGLCTSFGWNIIGYPFRRWG